MVDRVPLDNEVLANVHVTKRTIRWCPAAPATYPSEDLAMQMIYGRMHVRAGRNRYSWPWPCVRRHESNEEAACGPSIRPAVRRLDLAGHGHDA